MAGVLSGYLIIFPKSRVRFFFFLGLLSHTTHILALLYIGLWFITQFFNGIGPLGVQTAETRGVAYWARIGGFVAGLALTFLFKRRPPSTRNRGQIW
ncbi:MAG: rhomboid family intramembrane serine protease [Anaerolineae bacterium]|nr:rhomboid family intramembrane serine protease [Anaerolineae bacterium]